MKRLAAFLTLLAFSACYTTPPPCDPTTIDWPRCIDPTQPARKADAGAPQLGASLLYPGRYVTSTDIVNATAIGRSVLTAADAAAIRTLLSIQDVGDLRNYAISRAQTVLGLTNPTVAVDEPFVSNPRITSGGNATSPSFFSGVATNVTSLSGGWKKITAGAIAGNTAAWQNYELATAQVVSNVGTQKWYQLWLVKLDAAADSTAQVQLGWIDTGFSVVQPLVGMQGASSTTKFRFFDGSTGATSAVNLDTSVHIIEHWCTGAGSINASVDGETTASYTTAKTNAVSPFVQVVTGSSGAQAASLGHLVVITAQQ